MKIKIKEPCNEDWSKMKIGMKSRHCESCVKSVMDFTAMSREEILIYLFKNNNQSTCARMYGGQMDFYYHELEAIIEGTRKQKGNLPFVVISLAAMALLSCNSLPSSNSDFNPTLGKIMPVELVSQSDSGNQVNPQKTIPINDNYMGEIIKEKPSGTALPERGEVKITTGKPLPIPGNIEVITGDVMAYPDPNLGGEIEIIVPEIDTFHDQRASIRDSAIYTIVEVMPEFPQGADSLFSYLANQIRYPQKAQKEGVEGRVFVQFTVNKSGSISDAKVLRGIGNGCDEEALRVVKNMPNWIPGENNGQQVNVNYTLPIKFMLKYK
jgi:TonB family protein